MPTRDRPSPDDLRELLAYNRRTGVLTWKPRTGKWSDRWNKRHAGQPAGTRAADGSIVVKVFDYNIPAHRVIFALEFGMWPVRMSHANGDRGDNRSKNLRALMPPEWWASGAT